MEEIKYYIWLQRAFINNPEKAIRILEDFGSPREFYRAKDKRRDYLTEQDIKNISVSSVAAAEKAAELCNFKDIQVIPYDDCRYPECFRNIPSPPFIIYAFGNLSLMDWAPIISVIGTRKCSETGLKAAAHFSYDLASSGAVICSGVANGIDSAAIEGALLASGKAIGIMACSLDVNYPANKRNLKRRLLKEGGLLLSEHAPTMKAYPANFNPRNRLLSAIADAVLAVEAPENSGTNLTVTHAIEQGKEVFAVPQGPYVDTAAGTNAMISEGIPAVFNANELLRLLPSELLEKIDFSKIEENSRAIFFEKYRTKTKFVIPEGLDENERKILLALRDNGAMNYEAIAVKTGIEASSLTSLLISLELSGYTETDRAGKISIIEK